MTCDHASATTPYCPFCGARLTPSGPLDELLAHCRKSMAQAQSHLERRRRHEATAKGTPHAAYAKQMADNAQASVARWARWVEALEPVTAGSDPPACPPEAGTYHQG